MIDSDRYNSKIKELLNDKNTYEQIFLQTINKNTDILISPIKKLTTQEDAFWSSIIDYHPKILKIYGLPKSHKLGIPLGLIISEIGYASNNIAKSLAKMLSPLLAQLAIRTSRSPVIYSIKSMLCTEITSDLQIHSKITHLQN